MKIAATVILYYPDASVAENILSYLPFVDRLYVMDNSENSRYELLAPLQEAGSKVHYYHDGENKGLAERLNQACQLAISDGFPFILTMDQDSRFDTNRFQIYIEALHALMYESKVAMVGVGYSDTTAPADEAVLFTAADHLITSGSVIDLSSFKQVGAFDEKLFIDQVDLEFCLRSRQNGYKIYLLNHVFLQHKLGVAGQYRSLKSLTLTNRSLHSPLRLYYMVRNYFYTSRKYKKDFPKEVSELRKDILNRIKNNLLYGKKRFSVVYYIMRGVKDSSIGKMGKIQ